MNCLVSDFRNFEKLVYWVLLSVLILAVSCGGCLAQQPSEVNSSVRDDRIGVSVHFSQGWSIDSVMPMIAQLGIGWIRDDLSWAELERQKGVYEIPKKTRLWINAARRHGLKVLLILNFANPLYSDPYDPKAYARAAAWLAKELKDEIHAIEVLNEPNNFGFRDTYGGAWNGFEPDQSVSPYVRRYVDLLNAAARAIKASNPSMQVIGLGAPPPASFRMIELGLARGVDGITDHPYSSGMPEIIPYSADADRIKRDGIATADASGTFVSQVSMFRTQARKFGATQAVWHTEWGHPTTRSRPEKLGLSEEGQAAYILRRLLESRAIGVQHTFIYLFKDEGLNPYSDYENFGLVRNDLSRKQAYFVIQRATNLLSATEAVQAGNGAQIKVDHTTTQSGLDPRCYTFASSNKRTVLVAFWEPTPWVASPSVSQATITLPSSAKPQRAWIYDLLSGAKTEITLRKSERNRASVDVSISGVPQMLIVRSNL